MEFNNAAILVLGDVMLDYYISGDITRVSPEAPVPVLAKRNAWSMPGGAANVARGLARLECRPRLVGLVGCDAAGETLRQQVAAEGVEAALVQSSTRQTTCKTRILARSQQLLRVDEETAKKPGLDELTALRLHLEKLLPGCKGMILSDYAKGVLLPGAHGKSLAAHAINLAQNAGIPVFVDPKGSDWRPYAGADCITPNSGEFGAICQALGLWHGEKGEPPAQQRRELAETLCRHFDFGHLLLTRGSRGMAFYCPGHEPVNIRAVMREVADVSGAGDTVISTLCACVAAGVGWPEAAAAANAAAGVAVTKMGAAPVGIMELNQALSRSGGNPKICAWPELKDRLRLWRGEGQRIVFTNGCFDLLHPGHISLLRQSAAFGDRLVVGLNSDASVRRLKGDARPIQDEQSRATLLAALEAVDAVVLFEEDTPQKLIEAIKPDILVKGSDYKVENIAGAAFVRSYGGQVRLVELVDGFSTTGITRRIQEDTPRWKCF